MAKILIGGAADVNAKDNNGLTPLHEAVYKGNLIFGLSFIFKTKTIKLLRFSSLKVTVKW